MGDADFVADFNAKASQGRQARMGKLGMPLRLAVVSVCVCVQVNNRHVAYRGAGSTGDDNYYEVGDFIAQVGGGSWTRPSAMARDLIRQGGDSDPGPLVVVTWRIGPVR